MFPALSPTAIPAFSIVSSARNKEGAVPIRVVANAKFTNPAVIRLSIELPSEKKFRSDGVDPVGRVPITPNAEIVTAAFVVEVIVETAKLAVLKTNACETGASGHRRCHDLHYDSDPPLLIA
jgi:hypothetical protein